MLINTGGHTVEKGTYWNVMDGQRVDADGETCLPGNSRTRYIKLPGAMMLIAGPVMGLAFALFLPFIGIAMTLGLVAEKLATGAAEMAVKSTTFSWRPIEAYLNGKQRNKKGEKDAKKDTKT